MKSQNTKQRYLPQMKGDMWQMKRILFVLTLLMYYYCMQLGKGEMVRGKGFLAPLFFPYFDNIRISCN